MADIRVLELMGDKMINSSRMKWTKLVENPNAHCHWEKLAETDPSGEGGGEKTGRYEKETRKIEKK